MTETTSNAFTAHDMATAAADGFRDGQDNSYQAADMIRAHNEGRQSAMVVPEGEAQRLREALENSRRAMFAVHKQETRLKAVAKRVLAAEIERIDAALSAQREGGV